MKYFKIINQNAVPYVYDAKLGDASTGSQNIDRHPGFVDGINKIMYNISVANHISILEPHPEPQIASCCYVGLKLTCNHKMPERILRCVEIQPSSTE